MKLLDIVLTTKDRLKTLKECVESIAGSNDVGSIINNIVVVDDGSSDSTSEYLIQLKKCGVITNFILNSKCHGPAFSRNRGIEQATGTFILIIGDDVILKPDALSHFNNHIRSYDMSNASVLGNIEPDPSNMTPFEHWSCNGGSQFGHFKIRNSDKYDAGEEYYYTCNVITPKLLLQKEPFNEKFIYARYEDREWSYRMKLKYNHKIHYLQYARSLHRHKLPFKEWLMKFDYFTKSALTFASLYPEDKTLEETLGICRAKNTIYYDPKIIDEAISCINKWSESYFQNEAVFGTYMIRAGLGNSFRVLQEFFRIYYYRRHLNLKSLCDINEKKYINNDFTKAILTKLKDC